MPSLDFSVGNTIGFHPVLDDTDKSNTELHMTWTGLGAHDQSQGFGHIILSAEPVVSPDIIAIEEVLNQYVVAMETGDLELWLSLHADDIVKMAPDAPATYGKEELRTSTKPLFDNFTIEMDYYCEEIQVDGDLGFARGTFTATMTPMAGGEPLYMDAKTLGIYKRQVDGSWKLARNCYNSNVPPA